MSQVTMTTTTVTLLITCVLQSITHHCNSSAYFHLCGSDDIGQQDVVLPPQLILIDTMRDSAVLTNVP